MRTVLSAVIVVLLAGCAPVSVPTPVTQRTDDSRPASTTTPKSVTVSFQREATGVEVFGPGATGRQDVMPLVQNQVAYEKNYEQWAPQLAIELASIDRGTWQISPDGTMEMTWNFHPNIRWHDGTPFSTEDIVFATTVRRDPEMAARDQGRLDLVTSVTAPDPVTLVIRWSAPYVDADRGKSLDPMPRHILQDLYQRDKKNFENNAYWNREFVGVGPYRVVNWEPGSHIELARFDDYYLGRPPLDSITVRFIPDENTLVASFLAGT